MTFHSQPQLTPPLQLRALREKYRTVRVIIVETFTGGCTPKQLNDAIEALVRCGASRARIHSLARPRDWEDAKPRLRRLGVAVTRHVDATCAGKFVLRLAHDEAAAGLGLGMAAKAAPSVSGRAVKGAAAAAAATAMAEARRAEDEELGQGACILSRCVVCGRRDAWSHS